MRTPAKRPVRLSAELVAQAAAAAALLGRSTAAQIELWARLGRAIELEPGYTLQRVRAALAGEFNVDALEPDERELFKEQAFDKPTARQLAFFEEGRQRGGGVGYDDQGNYVQGLPGGGTKMLSDGPDEPNAS